MLSVGIVFAPVLARLVRAQTLIVKQAVYVDAVSKSANKLVQDRLMLQDDATWYIDMANKADIGRPRN